MKLRKSLTQRNFRMALMLAKEMGNNISTCQMQYDAGDNEIDQKNKTKYTLEGTVRQNGDKI